MIVITGASDGLGKSLAEKLSSSKEEKIIIIARDENRLKEIAEATNAHYFVCDVRKPEMVKRVFDQIHKDYGTIDVLINNAGVIINGDLVETDDADIENVIETNTLGAIYVAKYALIGMKQAKRGLIINVVSQSGLNARASRSIYNASKWALTGFTKALQQEVAPFGIKVTGFYPGTIKTRLFAKAGIELSGPSVSVEEAVAAIEYVIAQPPHILIPQIDIKHLEG